MTEEELRQRVRESAPLLERLDKCRKMIGNMCSERRPPQITIPLQWYDEDFFISTTLQDAAEYIKTADALTAVFTRED